MEELTVPQLGEGLVEIRLVRMLKRPGERVERDEPLYEAETAKACMVIESPVAGVVTEWLAEEDAVVAIGAVLARIDTGAAAERVPPQRVRVPPRTRAQGRAAGWTDAEIDEAARTAGRALTEADFGVRDYRDEPASAARRGLNQALLAAQRQVVPALVSAVLDGAALTRAATRLQGDAAVFATDFGAFAYYAARAAAAHPSMRTRRLPEEIRRVFDHVNLGIAVSDDAGDLRTAMIRDAGRLSFADFSAAYAHSVGEAMAGRGAVDGTVTLILSHLDSTAARNAVPVVVAPATATLFLVAPALSGERHVALAFDHLVFNGLQAARFLETLVAAVEEPSPAAPVRRPAAAEGTEVARILAAVREITGGTPDPDLPLGQQGLTSRGAVELVTRMNELFQASLPATAVWHHPTARRLAEAVTEPARPLETPGRGPLHRRRTRVAERIVTAERQGGAVAISGLACRLPGADGVEEFWDLLCREEDVLREVPPARLPGFEAADPRTVRAGLLDRVDGFDAPFFGMTPRLAAAVDPQQRMLLELTWHALEDAGLSPDDLAGSSTGVFIGAAGSDYRELAAGNGIADGYTAVGTLQTYLANRISQHFDFHGPSLTVDTACSGSLSAVALAVDALRAGRCDTAVVGSANVICNGFNASAYYRAGMLSPTGAGTAFDDSCDGYVRGEGGVVMVLRRQADALSDGSPIAAVIRGCALNHGGRAASQTAPNPVAQADLIRTALADAGLAFADLGYLEAHGTATPLGDPIELEALMAAGRGAPTAAGPEGRLWVGSAKASIGHLEGAAGMAGLLKAALVVQRGHIPALPGFTRPNRRIDLSSSLVQLADRAADWPVGQAPRRAGVNAFGLGGSNGHVVLEQPPARVELREEGRGPWAFPLSAATPRALRALAAALATRVADTDQDLAAIAATLQVGRASLKERALVLAGSAAELADRLTTLAEPDQGELERGLGAQGAAAALEWLAGGRGRWRELWAGRTVPRPVPLVPYPFERAAHWLPIA